MFKVWWDIDICLFYKFTTECVSGKKLKIGQYLVNFMKFSVVFFASRCTCRLRLLHRASSSTSNRLDPPWLQTPQFWNRDEGRASQSQDTTSALPVYEFDTDMTGRRSLSRAVVSRYCCSLALSQLVRGCCPPMRFRRSDFRHEGTVIFMACTRTVRPGPRPSRPRPDASKIARPLHQLMIAKSTAG